jgi:inosine/xanthosine triphosphate pyrophosphatase family protein
MENEIIYFAMDTGSEEQNARLKHFKGILKGLPVEVEPAYVSPELRADRINDLIYIAGEYAQTAYEIQNKPCVGFAVGFYVKALNNRPGTLLEEFLRVDSDKDMALNKFISMIKDKRDRNCEFRQCLVYNESGRGIPFQSVVEGRIADKPRGSGGEEGEYPYWSQYSRVFIPEGQDMTLAEMIDKSKFDKWQKTRTAKSATGQFALWLSKILNAQGEISDKKFQIFLEKLDRRPEDSKTFKA